MGYYVMLDSPTVKIEGTRKFKQRNKPRRLHKTLDIAIKEASRLANKTGYRALILKLIDIVIYPVNHVRHETLSDSNSSIQSYNSNQEE